MRYFWEEYGPFFVAAFLAAFIIVTVVGAIITGVILVGNSQKPVVDTENNVVCVHVREISGWKCEPLPPNEG